MMRIKNIFKYWISAALVVFFFADIRAAGEGLGGVATTMMYILLAVVAFILWILLIYNNRTEDKEELFTLLAKRAFSFLDRSAPLEKEKEILLDHDYDGIHELDNRVPPWFNILFYGTIIFGIIYVINYHILGGKLQEAEYSDQMQQARIEKLILVKTGALLTDETVTKVDDAGSLQSGKEIYVKNCVTCHGQGGGGLVGPNLTDDYWIHGGGIKNIFRTIRDGVPSKGMISWQSQLSPKQIQEVGSYIISLHGTNPPGGKEPQGDLYKEDNRETDSGKSD